MKFLLAGARGFLPFALEGFSTLNLRVFLRFDLFYFSSFYSPSLLTSGTRAVVSSLGFVMASMKYDLPMLDYKIGFSLWQVKMRAILAQTNDLDETLEKFGKKKKDEWTDEEKRKDRKALSLIQLHLSNDILQEVLQEKTAAELLLDLHVEGSYQ